MTMNMAHLPMDRVFKGVGRRRPGPHSSVMGMAGDGEESLQNTHLLHP